MRTRTGARAGLTRMGGPARRRGDDGGVWIVIGIVLGLLVYAGMVTTVVAGFTAAVPFVLVPPVVVGLIGANSLLGGGHARNRPPPSPRAAEGDDGGEPS